MIEKINNQYSQKLNCVSLDHHYIGSVIKDFIEPIQNEHRIFKIIDLTNNYQPTQYSVIKSINSLLKQQQASDDGTEILIEYTITYSSNILFKDIQNKLPNYNCSQLKLIFKEINLQEQQQEFIQNFKELNYDLVLFSTDYLTVENNMELLCEIYKLLSVTGQIISLSTSIGSFNNLLINYNLLKEIGFHSISSSTDNLVYQCSKNIN